MKAFKALAAAGKGKVAAILPDTVSSTRYVEFDQPDITKALSTAGLSSSQYVVQNALGSDATQLTDAQTDITNGATVLLVDPLDSGVGAQIESYAKSHGVKVIDYDRLTLGGSRAYYVSFNNVDGRQGHGRRPRELRRRLEGQEAAGRRHARCRDGQQRHTVRPGLRLGDQPVLQVRQVDRRGQHRRDVGPADGRDRVPGGLHRAPERQLGADPQRRDGRSDHHLPGDPAREAEDLPDHRAGRHADRVCRTSSSGYQCGTVYKPIYLEAQAAVALALYLRAGKTPPASLVNGKTEDTTSSVSVPSVLETPEWVTTANMNATVIKDNFVPASQLCAGSYASRLQGGGHLQDSE